MGRFTLDAISISRRTFLRGAFGLSAGALALSVPLVGLAGCQASYPEIPRTLFFFTQAQWATLDAATRRLAPSGPGRLGAGEVGVATAADALFAHANPTLQADLKRLLDVFEDLSYANWHLTPFTTLDASAQDTYLKSWQIGFVLQRQGFVGLNRLASMIFYMDERSWKQIGFSGPWVGKRDVGLGLDNQGPMAANPNPNIYLQVPELQVPE
jgi:hypothetical protein